MAGGGNVFKVSRGAWKSVTARLVFLTAVYSLGNIFFGYDGASFGGVQAFGPFRRQFGVRNDATGQYALPARLASIMNSMGQVGKLVGTLIVGPLVERLGHKKAMGICCLVQLVGAIVQVTATTVAQFTTGRVFIYIAVGLVDNIVPTFESEITPAPLRGFFVGSLQLFLTFGSLIAGIVNEFCRRYTSDLGWKLATGIQLVPAVAILSMLYFTTDSPRWLYSRGRTEEALQVLKGLRTREDNAAGLPEKEIEAWAEAGRTTRTKAPWSHLFLGTNLRRTLIACAIMSLQQLTGVTFSSSYGPTYFRSVGLGANAFKYAAINNGVSVVTALMGMVLFDLYGRRDIIFYGCFGQSLFLFLTGGLGSKVDANTTEQNTMVASFILYAAILHMSLGPGAYITAGEVGTASLREKTMAISTAINVVVGFAVVYSTPYLIDGIGAKTAYIWGACAFVGAAWTWLCLPELRGRTLEEIDQIFEAHVPAWRSKSFEAHGVQHEVANMQAHVDDGPKSDNSSDKEVGGKEADDKLEMAMPKR